MLDSLLPRVIRVWPEEQSVFPKTGNHLAALFDFSEIGRDERDGNLVRFGENPHPLKDRYDE